MSELMPLPTPEFATPLLPAKDRGRQGDLEWIPLAKLFVDRSYQRDVKGAGKLNIRKIAEGFHWSLFSPLIVSPRGKDRYAIIDGQHRAIAAKLHGAVGSLPCLIVHATPAEEARAFAVINGNVTKMQTQYMFRARVAAGVRIMPYPVDAQSLKPNETLACGTIEAALKSYGEAGLRCALTLIMAAAKGESGLLRAHLIIGLAHMFSLKPEWQPELAFCGSAIAAYGLKRLHEESIAKNQNDSGARGKARQVVTQRASAIIAAAFAKAGKRAAPVSAAPGGSKPSSAPASAVPKPPTKNAEVAQREQAVIRAGERGAAPAAKPAKAAALTERELIEAHLKAKGVRKFESGATGDTSRMLDWLSRECKRKARRLNSSSGGAGGKIYEIDGEKHTLSGLIAIVNHERSKRKLEPISLGEAA